MAGKSHSSAARFEWLDLGLRVQSPHLTSGLDSPYKAYFSLSAGWFGGFLQNWLYSFWILQPAAIVWFLPYVKGLLKGLRDGAGI